MSEEKVVFEEKLKRLNEIVSLIENEDLPLDESIKLYEEGTELISLLSKELEKAEAKIEKVVDINKK